MEEKPFLEELALNDNQLKTIPENLVKIFPCLLELEINNNHITEIDEHYNGLNYLRKLELRGNQISQINNANQILALFPALTHLNLNQNPLTDQEVNKLRDAAQEAGREITIIANDIGDQYTPPAIKPAKS